MLLLKSLSEFNIKSVALPPHNLSSPRSFLLYSPEIIEHINYFLLVFLLGGKDSLEKMIEQVFFVIKRAIFVAKNHHTMKLILQINRSNTVI